MQIRSLFKVVPKEGNFQPPGNLFKPALLSFYFKSLRGHISKASALWVFKKQRLPFCVVIKLILPIFDHCGEFGASIRAGPEVSREFFFYIWIYLGFNLCCCCCRSLNGLNDIERDLLQATWRNIYVYTQIFLNSNWSFLKSQFIMERNISQICPTAVFSMDVFSLRSAICSNYSFIVFGVKAWQVYNHCEKFLECISFHLGRGNDFSTLELVCPSTDEVGWKQTELEHSELSVSHYIKYSDAHQRVTLIHMRTE